MGVNSAQLAHNVIAATTTAGKTNLCDFRLFDTWHKVHGVPLSSRTRHGIASTIFRQLPPTPCHGVGLGVGIACHFPNLHRQWPDLRCHDRRIHPRGQRHRCATREGRFDQPLRFLQLDPARSPYRAVVLVHRVCPCVQDVCRFIQRGVECGIAAAVCGRRCRRGGRHLRTKHRKHGLGQSGSGHGDHPKAARPHGRGRCVESHPNAPWHPICGRGKQRVLRAWRWPRPKPVAAGQRGHLQRQPFVWLFQRVQRRCHFLCGSLQRQHARAFWRPGVECP